MSSSNNDNKKLFTILTLIVLVETITWFCLKKQYLTNKKVYLCLFLVFYAFIPILLIQAVKYEGIGLTNMLWNIASTTLILIMGCYLFNENVNKFQYLGIGLGLISIILLTCNRK